MGEAHVRRPARLVHQPSRHVDDHHGCPAVVSCVDAMPPEAPQWRVSGVTADSVSFTWDPVVDVGDGAGVDYFVAGMDHYTSWLTVDGGSQRLQLLSTAEPRTITQSGMRPLGIACAHRPAFDRGQNSSAGQITLSRALATPPMPDLADPATRV